MRAATRGVSRGARAAAANSPKAGEARVAPPAGRPSTCAPHRAGFEASGATNKFGQRVGPLFHTCTSSHVPICPSHAFLKFAFASLSNDILKKCTYLNARRSPDQFSDNFHTLLNSVPFPSF